MVNLAGKIAIVTGGGSGIGRAVCVALAHHGARVVVGDVNSVGGEETVALVEKIRGPKAAVFVLCDVTNERQVEQLFAACHRHFASCFDILFNNAGIGEPAYQFATTPFSVLRKVIDINFTAVVHGTHLGVQELKKNNKEGVIISTASMGAILPMADSPVYAGTKSAVAHFTRSLAHLGSEGIRVCAICPTFTDTPLVHQNGEEVFETMKRTISGIMSPEFVAESFIALVADESKSGAVMRLYLRRGQPSRDYWPREKTTAPVSLIKSSKL